MKRVNINYNNSGDIIEITIKEYNGRKLENFRFNGNNSTMYGRIIENLYEKYGFRPTISIKECINFVNKPEDKSFFEA